MTSSAFGTHLTFIPLPLASTEKVRFCTHFHSFKIYSIMLESKHARKKEEVWSVGQPGRKSCLRNLSNEEERPKHYQLRRKCLQYLIIIGSFLKLQKV